ncbi:MAG: hypothetical protein J5620_01990 [Alphaproteobacteria bacterium]|nr:hypothetical protein [Alphaproteobacteria bacterium]
MSDYLQEVKEEILDKMFHQGIVAQGGEILDEQKYTNWLTQAESNIKSQIAHHTEPGGYNLNLLYKDLEVVQEMLRSLTDSKPSGREQELMERFSAKQEKRNAKIQNLKNGAKRVIRLFSFQRKPGTPEHTK